MRNTLVLGLLLGVLVTAASADLMPAGEPSITGSWTQAWAVFNQISSFNGLDIFLLTPGVFGAAI